MGWSIGYDSKWKRDVGYGVPSFCDHPGCSAVIDRGLSYVCGGGPFGGDHGCGLYFCSAHLRIAGDARNNVQVCSRCYGNRFGPYTKTPDHPDWLRHKLTDESWAEWRRKHPMKVVALEAALSRHDRSCT